jgi:hypothetical protein
MEELLRLKRHNQDLLTQIKKLKHDKKSLQEELDRKTSLVDKGTMTGPIKKLSNIQISTSKKGTNTKLVSVQIQKNVYIDKSLQTSKEDGSKEKLQEIRMPYRHPNHKSHYAKRQDQKIYKQHSSYIQTNYKFIKEER